MEEYYNYNRKDSMDHIEISMIAIDANGFQTHRITQSWMILGWWNIPMASQFQSCRRSNIAPQQRNRDEAR